MSQKDTTPNPSVEQLQKLHRRRMTIFGSIILIAGIAIGSASTVILMPRPERFAGPDPAWLARRMAERLEDVLDLTAEQKRKTREVFKTAFTAIHAIQAKAKPEIDEIIKKMKFDISNVLTPEQNARWQQHIDKFNKGYHDRWRRGRRPGEGGPGPGFRRGPGDPNRDRRGPGGRPGDPNRPHEGFHRGAGPFGPRYGPGDPNRPRGDFDREAMMRERYRRGDGPFDRRPRPNEPPASPPGETPTGSEAEAE